MTFPRSRILLALLLMTLTGALVAPAASQADAGSGILRRRREEAQGCSPQGGKVRKAWPAKKSRGNRPNKKLAQFLAKQVGPTKVAKKRRQGRWLRSSTGPLQRLPARRQAKRPAARALVRRPRAAIPTAARMANLSWTYDSALAAVALITPARRCRPSSCSTSWPRSSARTARSTSRSTSPTARACSSSTPARSPGSASPPRLYGTIYGSSRYDALAGGASASGCSTASVQRPAGRRPRRHLGLDASTT